MMQKSINPDWEQKFLGEFDYAYALSMYQVRYYQRLGALCNFIQIFLGTGVATALFAQNQGLAIAAGVASAAIGIAQFIFQFDRKATLAEMAKKNFLEFEAGFADLSEKDAKAEFKRLQASGVESFESLETIALNWCCKKNSGNPRQYPEGFFCKLVRIVV